MHAVQMKFCFTQQSTLEANTDQHSRKINEVTLVWGLQKETTQRVFEQLIFRVKILKMGSTASLVLNLGKSVGLCLNVFSATSATLQFQTTLKHEL